MADFGWSSDGGTHCGVAATQSAWKTGCSSSQRLRPSDSNGRRSCSGRGGWPRRLIRPLAVRQASVASVGADQITDRQWVLKTGSVLNNRRIQARIFRALRMALPLHRKIDAKGLEVIYFFVADFQSGNHFLRSP